jgi:hypothetical protein
MLAMPKLTVHSFSESILQITATLCSSSPVNNFIHFMTGKDEKFIFSSVAVINIKEFRLC